MASSPHRLIRLGGGVLLAGCALVVGERAEAQQRTNLPPALRATLERPDDPAQRVQITDPDGQVMTEEARPSIQDGAVVFERPIEGPHIVRLEQVERMAMPAELERIALPGGLVVPDALSSAQPAWFQLTVGASPTPAVWDESRQRYTTRLWFGLRASDHAPPDLVPNQPVAVRLGFVGLNADEVDPLQLERPGLEHERLVDLYFIPTTANPTLEVRSTLTSVDFALEAPGRLEVRPVNLEIPGLGLGTTGVAVTHVLPHGESAPAPRDLHVSLTIAGRASPDTEMVTIREGESESRFALRSSGLGSVTVRAQAGALSGSTTIQQLLPLGPWLAGLFGGALGGFARSFLPKARRRSTGRRVLEGLVVASIAYVAVVLGVLFLGLPAVVAATEAGAFLTGAIAGFSGVVLIERLTRIATAPQGAP